MSQAKREALTRQVLGAVAVVGGIMAGQETNSSAGSAAATAAVVVATKVERLLN